MEGSVRCAWKSAWIDHRWLPFAFSVCFLRSGLRFFTLRSGYPFHGGHGAESNCVACCVFFPRYN